MAHILVVDDESNIRTLIRKYAEFSGHTVTEAEDGMQAVKESKSVSFDAVILDIMMPELDGFSVCREIRRFSDVPIIMLSARGEEYDRINGFECGADDYVTKPFSPRELMLRVDAVLRRRQAEAPKEEKDAKATEKEAQDTRDIYVFDGVTVDFTARVVTVDGVRAELSPKEYELLFYMIRNRGIALSRERLLNDIWGYRFFGGDRTLDTHMKLLRKKLGIYSSHLVTLRGMGYRFDE